MQRGLKGLLLLALGYFLFSRITGGTLFFYINNRFAWLTFLAVIGFFVVASGYLYQTQAAQAVLRPKADGEDAEQDHDPGHHHGDDHPAHDEADHGHSHGQRLTWIGAALILLPVLLGTLIPPKPLGAAALTNREVSISGLSSAVAPGNSPVAAEDREKNLLDWLIAFDRSGNPADFSGQEAAVIGFVYRDDRFAADSFMVSRFIVSCCVADATPIGLIVRWPEANTLATDQWVTVTGRFEPGQFDGRALPVLVADQVAPTAVPNQPYLFP